MKLYFLAALVEREVYLTELSEKGAICVIGATGYLSPLLYQY